MISKLILCRTMWMRHYDGRPDDPPFGKHRWVTQGGDAHEAFNFLPAPDGNHYGQVHVKDDGAIRIERLGASKHADALTDILMIWCAQHPDGRGLVITGWYQHATVNREEKLRPDGVGFDDGVIN